MAGAAGSKFAALALPPKSRTLQNCACIPGSDDDLPNARRLQLGGELGHLLVRDVLPFLLPGAIAALIFPHTLSPRKRLLLLCMPAAEQFIL